VTGIARGRSTAGQPGQQLDYDAVIVGGRVAGAAVALLLARRGYRVLVVDRERRGRDTLSTHALMRAGVVQLQRWGLLDAVVAAGTPPVHRVTFHYGDDPVPIDVASPLYAPRRTVLDAIIVAAAEEAGAQFRFGVRVDDLIRNGDGRVVGVRGRTRDGGSFAATARMTIGADGRNSLVAGSVNAPVTRAATAMTSVLYSYWSGVETSGYEWCYNSASRETRAGASTEPRPAKSGTSAGLIATNHDQVCVWVSAPPARFYDEMRFDRAGALERIIAETTTDVSRRVARGRRVGPIRGFPGIPSQMRRPWGPGWALVGDAGYLKDALTAHGISDALRDAELLATALDTAFSGNAGEATALRQYERTRDDLSIVFFDATDRIASYDWDLQQLQVQHRILSDAMRHETKVLWAWNGAPTASQRRPDAQASGPGWPDRGTDGAGARPRDAVPGTAR
jgi:flavin-dependent dehydrogenase